MKLTLILAAAVSLGSLPLNAFQLPALGAAEVAELSAQAGALPEPSVAAARAEKGEALIPAKAIQLLVLQDSVDLSAYTAEMSVRCSYKAGLIWPQSRSCGRRELAAEITSDNRLLIPAVEAFEGFRGRDLKNFSISVVVRGKNDESGYLFSLSARGKEALKAYAAEKNAFTLLKMAPARVEVLLEGLPLSDSPLAKDPRASLMSFVSIVRGAEPPGIVLTTPLEENYSFDNRGGNADGVLADLRDLRLDGGVLVEKAGEAAKLRLVTRLRLEGPEGETTFWDHRVEIEKTADGLAGVGRADLKKQN